VLADTNHVQALTVPVLQCEPHDPPKQEGPRRYRWLSQLLKEPQRSAAAPAGCDPDVFAADVAEYLARTDALRNQMPYRRVTDYSDPSADRRRTPRKGPGDVPFISAELVAHRADLVNVSAGGALLRMEVRPLPRDGGHRELALTLRQFSGEEIRQTGRPIRCHVRPIGEGRVLYEVAFRFDQDLGVLLQSLEPIARAELPALPRARRRAVGAR
jgi:hypothetical protein